MTGKAPDFFVAHRADRFDLLALVAVVTVAPPTGLWTLGWLASLVRERLGRLAHHGMIVLLGVLLAVEVARHALPLRGTPLVGLAILAGLGLGWLYRRPGWLRLWLRYLAPAPLVFALLFATTSPSGTLLLSSDPKPRHAQPVASPSPPPPVVVVVFDEFPLQSLLDSHGRIDWRVYPNVAAFADQATWYRHATGVSGSTQWAVPAMLTGRYPSKAKAPTAREYTNNLFSLLGQSYHLEVSEAVTKLCPTR